MGKGDMSFAVPAAIWTAAKDSSGLGGRPGGNRVAEGEPDSLKRSISER
jgi:hypothetical protein